MDETALYCGHCGQSIKESKLSFIQIVKDASSNLLNLDSRLIHTIRHIFLPAKLTLTYVAGKRKYYVNPARLFLFSLLALISIGLFTIDLGIPSISQEITEEAANIKIYNEFDSVRLDLETQANKPLFDSLHRRIFENLQGVDSDTIGKNLNLFGRNFGDYGITKYDAVHLAPDDVIEKYEIEGLRQQLEVKQFLKISANTAGGVKYIIKNFSWVILLLVFIMALVLKMLYIRRNYYYVEHLVHLLYGHSLLFLLAIGILILEYFDLGNELIPFLAFILIVIIQFISLLFYYKQGVFKTLFKMFIFNGIYLFFFVLVSLIVSLVSVLIF